MQVRVLGAHNLETESAHHTCFLIDEEMAIDAGSIVSTLSRDEQLRIRQVLLTHLHFDHTRDIPTLGLQTLDFPHSIDVYSLGVTLAAVHDHLIDGYYYPDLTKQLNDTPPAFKFIEIRDSGTVKIGAYEITPVPAKHPVPTIGYIVKGPDDCVAYTGDTGGDLLPFMQQTAVPRVLFVDVTFPNFLDARAEISGHLTPNMLKARIADAQAGGVTLPKIVPVHMSLEHQSDILSELSAVERELGIDLEPGYEGMMEG